MIRYREVTVSYGEGAPDAVHSVSFSAERGTVTALVGPNGSGKSTLVRAMLRTVRLVSGEIYIDGVEIDSVGRAEFARTVSVVTQREDTTFVRTVREHIELGRFPHRGQHGGNAAAVIDAAERAGVVTLLDRPTDAISGGEWQRVRVARALAQGGGAIVLDEPTAFLDIAHEMQMFEMLAALAASGIAVVLVSHQLNLVARFANSIVLLHHGKVAATGAPEAIMRGDLLESVYGWPLVVTRDPAIGAPALVPLRRAH